LAHELIEFACFACLFDERALSPSQSHGGFCSLRQLLPSANRKVLILAREPPSQRHHLQPNTFAKHSSRLELALLRGCDDGTQCQYTKLANDVHCAEFDPYFQM
jgi:hypothetical protein